MKVVLDTNVLVSGLLSPSGAPGEIIRMAVSGVIELIYDARVLWEYEEVLKRPKFGIPEETAEDIVLFVENFGHITAAAPLKRALPDRDDEPFLEIAVAGKADLLITGNLGHYPSASRHGTRVVSPADFIREYRAKSARG